MRCSLCRFNWYGWLSLVLLIAAACSTPTCCTPKAPSPADAPTNYHLVADALVRSAQPTTLAQWMFLKGELDRLAPGKQHYVIKLNFPDEGSDDLALKAGFIIIAIPIQPAGDKDVFDNALNTFVQPSDKDLDSIESAIELHRLDGLLVHCTFGNDRTGFTIARDRVLHYKWTKARARQEWQDIIGFPPHPLHGLDDKWEDWKVN